jgi:hypothetical protein
MTARLEVDIIVENSPPELSFYISSNHHLPSNLSSLLDDYLSQLSGPIESLQAEILALEEILRIKKESLDRGKVTRDAHLRIKAPIRQVPQDILGVIFPYAVDIPPFNKYIHVSRLRGVCALWRRTALTTPGLWSSLTIDMTKWISRGLSDQDERGILLYFKNILAPWMRILCQPYHLNLTSSGNVVPGREHAMLVQHMLLSLPHPNSIYLMSESAYLATSMLPNIYHHIAQVQLLNFGRTVTMGKPWLQVAFPNLAALVFSGGLGLSIDWIQHLNLRRLRLGAIFGTNESFLRLLQILPSLRELHPGSISNTRDRNDLVFTPSEIYAHPSLKVLTFTGEVAFTRLCRFVKFPSLRFLSIAGGSQSANDAYLAKSCLGSLRRPPREGLP